MTFLFVFFFSFLVVVVVLYSFFFSWFVLVPSFLFGILFFVFFTLPVLKVVTFRLEFLKGKELLILWCATNYIIRPTAAQSTKVKGFFSLFTTTKLNFVGWLTLTRLVTDWLLGEKNWRSKKKKKTDDLSPPDGRQCPTPFFVAS